MDYSVLGCGRFYITSNYNATGNLIRTREVTIVADLGRGCLRALTELGVQIGDVDVICISHLHPDHVGDLLAFFQTHFIDVKRGQSQRHLTIIGPTGIQTWLKTMAGLVFEDPLPYEPTVYENPTTAITLGDVVITTAPMQHNVPDLAFRFDQGSSSLVYSGDTGPNDAIYPLAHNVDLLVLECANEPGQQTAHHLNPQNCGEIAAVTNAKQLVLTHYGGKELKPMLERETAKYYSGILTVAEELLTIHL